VFREEVGLSERVGEEGFQDDTNMHFEYFENSLQGSPVVNAEKSGAIDECAGGGVLSALECAENGAVTEPGNSLQGAYDVKAELELRLTCWSRLLSLLVKINVKGVNGFDARRLSA